MLIRIPAKSPYLESSWRSLDISSLPGKFERMRSQKKEFHDHQRLTDECLQEDFLQVNDLLDLSDTKLMMDHSYGWHLPYPGTC